MMPGLNIFWNFENKKFPPAMVKPVVVFLLSRLNASSKEFCLVSWPLAEELLAFVRPVAFGSEERFTDEITTRSPSNISDPLTSWTRL